ncbi:unnamed protein product, partial [Symbiodinium sp. KB8]
AGQWKLLQDVPSLNMPSGEPWECGLQLQQWISEFTTVASCVALEFNQYFLKQLEAAKSRYDARQIQLKPEDIEAPPVPSHCEEMENRLSLTLMRVLPEQLRKPVMEQSAGQRVSSARMLEGVFERFIPGGFVGHPASHEVGKSTSCYLPGIAPHELVASVNAMTEKLEGKHASLATRLNLLRLSPELIVPSEAGLNTLVATLETEARRMGAEEDVRLLHRLEWTELLPSQGDAPELEIAVWNHYALNGVGSGISVLGWEIDQVDLPSDGSQHRQMIQGIAHVNHSNEIALLLRFNTNLRLFLGRC